MTTDLAVRTSVEGEISGFQMHPRTLDEALKYCQIMADSDLVPDAYRKRPGNILVAIQLGQELGLSPMRALRCIAIINGRASMWGDEMLAMVQASPVCEYVREQESTEKQGVCRVKRKNDPEEHTEIFTLEDAKRAGLLGKSGPWQNSTRRMLKLRARGFALRDKFADVLAGLVTVEEAMDLPPVEPTDPKVNILEAAQPLTLKDKLKAKVDATDTSVLEPTTEEVLRDMGQDGLKCAPAGQFASEKPHPASQDAAPPHDIFASASAVADYSVMLNECQTQEERDQCWAEIQKDPKVDSVGKSSLYQQYKKLSKKK